MKTSNAMLCKIQVTFPNRIENVQRWADYDGRSLANFYSFLLKRAGLEGKEKGAELQLTVKQILRAGR